MICDCLDLKVVVKPTHKTVGHILNGRAAEVAGCEDVSSSDEDDDAIHPRFARPDNMKLLLESMFGVHACVILSECGKLLYISS